MMNCCKSFITIVLSLAIAISAPFTVNGVSASVFECINASIGGILSYKFGQYDNTQEILSKLSKAPADNSTDWYYIALSRYGISGGEGLPALKSKAESFYNEGLVNTKVTDMQRVALALLSCNADITDVNGHNLLADCTYNREKYTPLDKQGVTGLAFALILLNSKGYSVPEGAPLTEDDIIEKILSKEINGGGFSILGSSPDVDATAIVLQSLAPHYNKGNVKPVIDRALSYLSKQQQSGGAYKSFGKENAESTAQVILALTSLDIDVFSDNRFIKSNKTSLDGLLSFASGDGGFCHIKGASSDNMATYQALCALVSCYRYLKNQSRFYCFTGDTTASVDNKAIRDTQKERSLKIKEAKADETEKSADYSIIATDSAEAAATGGRSPASQPKKSGKAKKSASNTEQTPPAALVESSKPNGKYYSMNRNRAIVTDDRAVTGDCALVFAVLFISYAVLAAIKLRGRRK